MKHFLPFVLSLFVFAAIGNAQVLSIEPAQTSGNGPASSNDIGAHATVTNTSSDTVRLLWTREIVSTQQSWTSWICDLNFCYLPGVGACPQNRPNKLGPGESIDFQVHIDPNDVDGSGQIHVQLYDQADPGTILGVVDATFTTGTSGVADLDKDAIKIFPNPTTSYFQVTRPGTIQRVALYSLVGNKVREFDARSGSGRFDVSDLTQGIYLVRLMDASYNVIKTVRLSKR